MYPKEAKRGFKVWYIDQHTAQTARSKFKKPRKYQVPESFWHIGTSIYFSTEYLNSNHGFGGLIFCIVFSNFYWIGTYLSILFITNVCFFYSSVFSILDFSILVIVNSVVWRHFFFFCSSRIFPFKFWYKFSI